jgi:hypothetical protein
MCPLPARLRSFKEAITRPTFFKSSRSVEHVAGGDDVS